MNDATAQYLNEMRYRMTEKQSGYKRGEFYSIRANGDGPNPSFRITFFLARIAYDVQLKKSYLALYL